MATSAHDGSTSELDLPAIAAWLAAQGWPMIGLEPLAGDVSPRRYLRAQGVDGATTIVAFYPESVRATALRFLRTGELLAGAGVRVPRILAAEPAAGLMLLEDVGGDTLYDRELDWPARGPWWRKAAAALIAVRRVPAAELATLNPPLDLEVLRRELGQTRALVLEPALAADPPLLQDTVATLDALVVEIDAVLRVPCHRDYMARNLVALEDGDLAVLDHQDLRLGPPAYDWASLLNDSLFAPAELERELLRRAAEVGVEPRDYRQSAVQRGFKAAGTFVAFAHRGSARHLPLVAPTLERALDHLNALEAGQGVAPALRRAFARTDLLQSLERLLP